MGIKRMQGVSSHIENIKKDCKTNKLVYCIAHTNLSIFSKDTIIKKYFKDYSEREIKIDKKPYKIKTSYNSEKELLLLNILYKNGNSKISLKLYFKLKDIIRIERNQVIFRIKLNTLIPKISKKDEDLSKLIKDNNTKDVIREATLSNEKEVTNSVDSLIKFTSYIIIRELLKIYK